MKNHSHSILPLPTVLPSPTQHGQPLHHIFRAILLAVILLAPISAQAGWDQLTPLQSPVAREGHGMAYDARRGVVVLFGGRDERGNLLDDLWEWNGWTWERRRPTGTVPPPLMDCMMTYDSIRGVTLLIGRELQKGLVGAFLWNGLGWSLDEHFSTPAGQPLPQINLHEAGSFGFGFDPRRRRTVVASQHGGSRPDSLLHKGIFDGNEWTTEFSSAPLFNARESSFPVALAFDPSIDDQLCFFVADEQRSDDRVELRVARWGNGQWLPLHTENIITQVKVSEFDLALAYDSRRGVAVAFVTRPANEGQNLLVEWDGSNWRQTSVPETAVGGALGKGYAMAYDELRGEVILFGGIDEHENVVAHTLRYVPMRGSFEPFGSGCTGSGGMPTMTLGDPLPPRAGERMSVKFTGLPPSLEPVMVQLGASNRTWVGLPLPLDLGFIGMTGCNWSISIDTGFIVPRFFGQAGWSTQLPLMPGAVFYLQGLVVDTAANAAGFTVSNAAKVVVGAR